MTTTERDRAAAADAALGGNARDRLLSRVADFVLANGVSDLSLSELARRVDSNNRMLLYYFSSKQQLLGEACELAITRFPRVDRVMTHLRVGPQPLQQRLLQVWADIAHPDNRPYLSLFFQAFAVALYDPGRSARVADLMGGTWVPQVVEALQQEGYEAGLAETLANEIVAELRGLQFALLAGTERAVLDRAYELFVDGLPAASG